jgi:hypothetical protein
MATALSSNARYPEDAAAITRDKVFGSSYLRLADGTHSEARITPANVRGLVGVIATERGVELQSLSVSRETPLGDNKAVFTLTTEAVATYSNAKSWISNVLERNDGIAVRRFSFSSRGTEPMLSVRLEFAVIARP